MKRVRLIGGPFDAVTVVVPDTRVKLRQDIVIVTFTFQGQKIPVNVLDINAVWPHVFSKAVYKRDHVNLAQQIPRSSDIWHWAPVYRHQKLGSHADILRAVKQTHRKEKRFIF